LLTGKVNFVSRLCVVFLAKLRRWCQIPIDQGQFGSHVICGRGSVCGSG